MDVQEQLPQRSKLRFSLLFLLILVILFSAPLALVRLRFDLERRYESDFEQKISELLAIPGLRVQSRCSLDNLFRIEVTTVSIRIPKSYCVRLLSTPGQGQKIDESQLREIEVLAIRETEESVIGLLPPPLKGEDRYSPIKVIVFDDIPSVSEKDAFRTES